MIPAIESSSKPYAFVNNIMKQPIGVTDTKEEIYYIQQQYNPKERDFVIATIKFISKKEFKLFLFKFYKNLYLRINPVNLYIYINDVSFLNEFNLEKIKKDLYLLNINPIDIEKLLKKSHK